MRPKVNEIDLFIDYITNPTYTWDPSKYKKREHVVYQTQLERNSFDFHYSYMLGTAYMKGTYGKDQDTIEVFYRELQGFQVVTSIDGREMSRASFPPHGVNEVKKHLNTLSEM